MLIPVGPPCRARLDLVFGTPLGMFGHGILLFPSKLLDPAVHGMEAPQGSAHITQIDREAPILPKFPVV